MSDKEQRKELLKYLNTIVEFIKKNNIKNKWRKIVNSYLIDIINDKDDQSLLIACNNDDIDNIINKKINKTKKNKKSIINNNNNNNNIAGSRENIINNNFYKFNQNYNVYANFPFNNASYYKSNCYSPFYTNNNFGAYDTSNVIINKKQNKYNNSCNNIVSDIRRNFYKNNVIPSNVVFIQNNNFSGNSLIKNNNPYNQSSNYSSKRFNESNIKNFYTNNINY